MGVSRIAAVGVGVAAAAWLGFRIRPRAQRPPGDAADTGPGAAGVALPADLPAVVARHYRATGNGGSTVPRIDTFALWGRARMTPGPLLRLPVTFWSEHRSGWSGRQRLAVTWYTIPILRAVDDYVDGRGRMNIGRRTVTGPEIDQGENLFLWAELVLIPSVLATRPGVRWEPVANDTARLRVPFGTGTDDMVFRFDPDTGLIQEGRAMRYRTPGKSKVGWRIGYERWTRSAAGMFPTRITVTWADHDRPWFVLDVDGVALNVPVDADLRQPAARTGRHG